MSSTSSQAPPATLQDLGLDQQTLMRLEFAAGLLDTLNIWMNVHDRDLRMVLWNKTAERITGYLAEDVLGHDRVWQWCYPQGTYRRPIEERAHSIVDQAVHESDYENLLHCQDGSVRSIRWFASPLYDHAGDPAGALVVGHDVTDLREHQQALERAHDEKAALFSVASIAAESAEIDEILQRCAVRVRELFSCQAVMIHLTDPDSEPEQPCNELTLRAACGLSPSQLSAFSRLAPEHALFGAGASPDGKKVRDLSFSSAKIPSSRGDLGIMTLLRDELPIGDESPLPLSSVAHQLGVAIENALLRDKAQRLAILEERSRLARELHDAVTQSVYSVQLFAEAGRRAIRAGQLDRADSCLKQLTDASADALKELRLLVFELRPTILEKGGLEKALRERLGSVERRSGIEAELLVAEGLEMTPDLEQDVYRIALEALNNSLKHAHASRVVVELTRSANELLLRITDNGNGFRADASDSDGGLGLESMRERAERQRGRLGIDSSPGVGTELSVEFPLSTANP